MTPEERELLEGLFERIKTGAPVDADKEAEEFISKSMKEMPHAGYVLSQAVIVQEEALKAAVSKIEELEASVQDLQDRAERAEQSGGSSFLGGIGKSLFGDDSSEASRDGGRDDGVRNQRPFRGGAASVPASRPPSGISVPPPPGGRHPGPWTHQSATPNGQPPGSGGNTFLKGALGAAAGVAGGMLLANAVGGLFSGNNNPLGIGGAKASESKDSSDSKGSSDSKSNSDNSSPGDDWKDDNSGDDWNENSGDDWDDDNAGDWGDDGGDWGDGGDW